MHLITKSLNHHAFLKKGTNLWRGIANHMGMLVVIFFLSYLSFGSIIHFNFAQDDFTILYYVQNHTLLFYPYYVASFVFTPLYYVFKLNASHYYLVSFLLFTCVGLSLYYFSLVLFKNRIIAFAATVFFITSFVGSDALYTMNIGILMNLFLIFELWTLSFYTMYLTSKKRKHLYFAFFLYTLTLFLFPYRAYTLFIFIFLLQSFTKSKKDLKKFSKLLLFILPFIFVYGLLPLIPIFNTTQHHTPSTIKLDTNMLSNFLKTLQNIVIPNTFIYLSSSGKAISKALIPNLYLLLIIGVLIWQKNKQTLLVLSLLLTSTLGFLLLFGEYYVTYDRYLYVVRPFYAVFLSALLFYNFRSSKFKVGRIILMIIFLPLIFTQIKQHDVFKKEIQNDRTYSKSFFEMFKKNYPTLNDYTIIFFHVEDVNERTLISRVTDVGALPHSGSFAVYYNMRVEKLEVVFYCENYHTILKNWVGKNPTVIYLGSKNGILIPKNPRDIPKDCKL